MTKPMTDERLLQIRTTQYPTYAQAMCFYPDLLAEVDRLRKANAAAEKVCGEIETFSSDDESWDRLQDAYHEWRKHQPGPELTEDKT